MKNARCYYRIVLLFFMVNTMEPSSWEPSSWKPSSWFKKKLKEGSERERTFFCLIVAAASYYPVKLLVKRIIRNMYVYIIIENTKRNKEGFYLFYDETNTLSLEASSKEYQNTLVRFWYEKKTKQWCVAKFLGEYFPIDNQKSIDFRLHTRLISKNYQQPIEDNERLFENDTSSFLLAINKTIINNDSKNMQYSSAEVRKVSESFIKNHFLSGVVFYIVTRNFEDEDAFCPCYNIFQYVPPFPYTTYHCSSTMPRVLCIPSTKILAECVKIYSDDCVIYKLPNLFLLRSFLSSFLGGGGRRGGGGGGEYPRLEGVE